VLAFLALATIAECSSDGFDPSKKQRLPQQPRAQTANLKNSLQDQRL
jgi:hypothetical protein